MSGSRKEGGETYAENFAVLERITDSLNKDEISIDDLLEKTREALDAARRCMEILNRQRGEFNQLEAEFARLIEEAAPADPGDDSGDNGQEDSEQ